jgi:hypothetical protein
VLTQSPPRRSPTAARTLPWETLLLGLAVLVVAGVYSWVARYGIDLIDEGYFMDQATRIMHGELPYRDFDTYYTPAILYLYAAAFSLAGVNVLVARGLMILVRLGCAVLLYRLGRRIMPRPFAALPPLLMLGADLAAQSHPAWPALFGTLLMLQVLVAADGRPTRRSMLIAGAAAGVSYAFKQNVGAFALLAALGYVLFRPRREVGYLLTAGRVVYAGGLIVVVRQFLAASLDELLGLTLWLPLSATLLLLVVRSFVPRQPSGQGLGRWSAGVIDVIGEGLSLGAGAVLVTLVWLIPLVVALGPRDTPFGLFVGQVNQGALTYPLEAPSPGIPEIGLAAVWMPIVAAGVFHRRLRRLLTPSAVAFAASLALPWLPLQAVALTPDANHVSLLPRLDWLNLQLGTLYLYVPALAAWLTVALLATHRDDAERDRLVPCYLLVGVFAQLAFFPRSDTVHALFAGTPLMLVGAWSLAQIHRRLTHGTTLLGQTAVYAALLILPTAAILPPAYRRYIDLVHPDPSHTVTNYVPLGLPEAPVLVADRSGANLRAVVDYIQHGTPPGQPFFAYPVDPMFNVLADRPNPTRFNHFIPGALTPTDQQQVIADLQRSRPRYILWDHDFVTYWETDPYFRPISDYIWQCYSPVEAVNLLLILELTGC